MLKSDLEKQLKITEDELKELSIELKREKKLADLIHRESMNMKNTISMLQIDHDDYNDIKEGLVLAVKRLSKLKTAIKTTAAILCPNLDLDGDRYDPVSQIELALKHMYDITNA